MSKSEYERLLFERKSIRSFRDIPIPNEKIIRLLWAAQGETRKGKRTVPSAGGRYPVFIYLLDSIGIYKYDVNENKALTVSLGDIRAEVARFCGRQEWIKSAPILFVVVLQYSRTLDKYRRSGDKYVLMEAGMAAQNLTIQAVNLRLGSCIVGAFKMGEVSKIMRLPQEYTPILIIPVGEPNA